MSTTLNETVAAVEYDGLIVDVYPPADVFAVTIKAGEGELMRGSVLSLDEDGTRSLMTEGGNANCILAEDVDATEEANALAYRTGHFASNRMIVGDGYELTAEDRETLRGVGILVSDAMEY